MYKRQTLARTAVLLLALTNQVLSAMGKPVLPIESATVEQLVTAVRARVAAEILLLSSINQFLSFIRRCV